MFSQILSVIFLFLSIFTLAQTGDNALADDVLQKAYTCQDEGKRDSAIYYFEKASIVYKKDNAWQKYIECIAGENRNYLRTDRIGDVEAKANEALKIVEDGRANEIDKYVIDIHTQLARFHWYAKGNFPDALVLLENALVICEQAEFEIEDRKVQVYTDFGYTYGYSGDFDNSSIYFKKAMELSKKVYGENADVVADRYTDMVFPLIQKSEWEKAEVALKKATELNIKNRGPEHISVLKNYNNLGYIYLEKFDNDLAILYLNKAIGMIRKQFSEDHRSIGIGYMNLGASYSNKGEFENGVKYSKMAIENLRTSIGKQNPYLGLCLVNLANSYNQLDNYDSAIVYFEKGLQLRLDMYGKEHHEVVVMLGYMSEFYIKYQMLEEAYDAVEKAMDIASRILPEKHKHCATNYLYLSLYYTETEQLEESIVAAQKALIALVPAFENHDVNTNPMLKDVISTRIIIDVLTQKTQAMNQLYDTTKDLETLVAASQTAEVTDKAIDLLRIEYQTPDSKELLLSRSKDFYEKGISIAFKLHGLTNSEDHLEQAFKYFEKSKSILLLENIKSNLDVVTTGVPDSIIIEEKSLSRSIAFYKEKLFEAKNNNDTVKLAALEDAFFQKVRDYDLLLNLIEEQYSEYYSIKHSTSSVTIKEVQNQQFDQNVIIEYFYGKEHIYALAISKTNISSLKTNLDKKLEMDLDGFVQGFEKKQFDSKVSHSVYTKILQAFISKGVLNDVNQITFIPDGVLHYIPFEILITSHEKAAEKKYLIHDYTINYLHSASLPELYQNTNLTNVSYLGFSPGYKLESESLLASRSARDNQLAGMLQKLPMAEEEVSTSASIWNGDYFFNENATEENFKRFARDAGIIHIASHAIIDDENPLNSKLVFSPGADSVEDGLLHTYELYNMKLNAQLACLSACNTGFGKIRGGEGVVSLAMGFFYAGVPNVMMTLWSVPDQSTSEIMTLFYKELKNGVGKADALRNAKLKFLVTADENTSDPYYWAAFTMIGDNEPLKSDNKFSYWLVGVVVMITIGGGNYFVRKQKRQA